MKKFITLCIICLSLSSNGAMAYYMIGNELQSKSQGYNRQDTFDGAAYLGYIQGIADAHDGLGIICIPFSKVTVGQLAAIVSQYLNANPGKWHLPASDLVVTAIRQYFPCKK